MKRYLLIILALFGWIITASSQNEKLSGKVLNAKNEPIVGASIRFEESNTGAISGVDGSFTLTLAIGKKYTLIISSVGYKTKNIQHVEVVSGQANELQVLLVESDQNTLGGVTVTANASTARKETAAALIQFQKNTNTVASVISAEAIRRSPDKTTGEVLKRVPGTSIMEGRFIVVRGLADRYNQAMINGILLTSTEPDRKTFSFDLIPAKMIDNIIINKTFVPEYPGEWAGGLIQVNTKDIPTKNFFNIEIGTGYNTQSTFKSFYKTPGGDLDWLGIDDGTRGFPKGYTTKSEFSILTASAKTAIGKGMSNAWAATATTAPLNMAFQANGGFNTTLWRKKLGGTFAIIYGQSNKNFQIQNRRNVIDLNYNTTIETDIHDQRYAKEIFAGALGSLSIQLNPLNRISLKSIINVNTNNFYTQRNGTDVSRNDSYLKGSEATFKENVFFTTQLTGEHSLAKPLTLKWYGAFNILDGYIPDQRRLVYSRVNPNDPWRAVIANSLSQQSGGRIYQSLSDYIYTGGGDLAYKYNWLGQKQTVKGGYMFQIKDRLYDAVLFANNLHADNDVLRQLSDGEIFRPENFGDGSINSNLFAFDALIGKTYRYIANTILNAGYIQSDNQFTENLRVVWGLRVEDYDQLIGSVKAYDERHTHKRVTDFLPGLNATWKFNNKTNLRLSGSQTVVRPELRELASLNLYDFELNASVQGNPNLERTKVINTDLRYELYPASGEVFTVGVFYKHFDKPIEQLLNEGGGGASTFSYQNPEQAYAYGAELEFRKRLTFINGLKNFTLQGNVAYIYSRVTDLGFDLDRSLQGQSPYVLNFGLLYDLEKAGFNATLLFNQIGERIYLVGDKSAGAGTPDTYEAPRPLFDLQFAKKFLHKKAELKLSISDLLNQTQYFYQNTNDKKTFQKETDAYRFTRKAGTTYSITFNYSL
ncbi:MAG TPA: TonB-dependent receptor [Chitinophagaceae bacterium]|nr:TonB-dependent receptor [Chitinophagaceae bacterium]